MIGGLLNTKEVADILKTSEGTVANLRKAGKLAATQVGRQWRFTQESVDAYLRGEPAPVPPASVLPQPIIDLNHDPEILAAKKTLELQKVKRQTADEAWAERKSQMLIAGCQECEAQKTSNKELAENLAQQQQELDHKLEEYATANEKLREREAKVKVESQEVKAERRALKADIKRKQDFEEQFDRSGSKWRKEKVEELLKALREKFHGYGNEEEASLVRRLEKIWLGEEVKK